MYHSYAVRGRGAMNWWGKLIGGGLGFLVGEAPGALVGVAIGHYLDTHHPAAESRLSTFFRRHAQQRRDSQSLFFDTLFALMGHVAKSKGRVTEADIAVAQTVMERMGLDATRKRHAIDRFKEGKSSHYPMDQAIERFRRQVDNEGLNRLILETLLEIAYANGRLSSPESRLLNRVRERLRFDRTEFDKLEELVRAERRFADHRRQGEEARARTRSQQRESGPQRAGRAGSGRRTPNVTRRGPPGAEYYAILGVSPRATEQEIRHAYRRLLSQHHPDKMMAQGLSDDAVKLAAHQTHEIKSAYEKIRRLRGF